MRPTGYTLFLGHTGSISINPSLYANAGFDPRKDFSPIGLIASMPVAVIAHPTFAAKTLTAMVELAKRDGSKFNLGTSAIGTGSYLAAELFKSAAGVSATLVPYKGTAQLMNDLLGNHVPVAMGVLPPALGNLRAGSCVPSRCSARAASRCLPDVPTSANPGCPGLRPFCTTGCSHLPERRVRSSIGSIRNCANWSPPRGSRSGSRTRVEIP